MNFDPENDRTDGLILLIGVAIGLPILAATLLVLVGLL